MKYLIPYGAMLTTLLTLGPAKDQVFASRSGEHVLTFSDPTDGKGTCSMTSSGQVVYRRPNHLSVENAKVTDDGSSITYGRGGSGRVGFGFVELAAYGPGGREIFATRLAELMPRGPDQQCGPFLHSVHHAPSPGVAVFLATGLGGLRPYSHYLKLFRMSDGAELAMIEIDPLVRKAMSIEAGSSISINSLASPELMPLIFVIGTALSDVGGSVVLLCVDLDGKVIWWDRELASDGECYQGIYEE